MSLQCPQCGKFCSDVYCIANGEQDIGEVYGTCKTHGKVDLYASEWSWEDFFGGEEY
jgi:formylmethanofuran dehydrogenase subunit B